MPTLHLYRRPYLSLDCLVAKASQSKVPLSSLYVTSISNMPLYRPRQLSFHELHPSIVIPAPNSLQSLAINFVPSTGPAIRIEGVFLQRGVAVVKHPLIDITRSSLGQVLILTSSVQFGHRQAPHEHVCESDLSLIRDRTLTTAVST